MEETKIVVKILRHKKRTDLAKLLSGGFGEINESSQFGHYLNSVISTYEFYISLDKFYKLKNISEEDKKIILESLLDIYPPGEGEPEIVDINFRILNEENMKIQQDKNLSTESLKSIRIFISYSSENKNLAGKIKLYLSNFGIEVFLAHEDISPSHEWQEVILQNLESTDIFIPLLTNEFKRSAWTDQETGFAIAKGKYIIPISINNVNPYGFIGKYQALNLDPEVISKGCLDIIYTLLDHEKYYEAMFNLLIKSLEDSNSFEDAGWKTNLLLNIKIKRSEQMDKIITAAIKHNQIRFSFKARTNLWKLFNKHKELVNHKLLEQLNELIDDYKFRLE